METSLAFGHRKWQRIHSGCQPSGKASKFAHCCIEINLRNLHFTPMNLSIIILFSFRKRCTVVVFFLMLKAWKMPLIILSTRIILSSMTSLQKSRNIQREFWWEMSLSLTHICNCLKFCNSKKPCKKPCVCTCCFFLIKNNQVWKSASQSAQGTQHNYLSFPKELLSFPLCNSIIPFIKWLINRSRSSEDNITCGLINSKR